MTTECVSRSMRALHALFVGLIAVGCASAPQPREQITFDATKVVVTPDGPDGLDTYDARALFERAQDLREGRLWVEAIAYYHRVLREFPDSPFEMATQFQLASCYIQLEQGAEALLAIDAFLARVVNDTSNAAYLDGIFKRGQALALLKRHEEAAALYDELLGPKLGAHLRPADRIEALVDSGVCHFMLGDVVTAEYRFLAAKRVHRESSQIERLEVKYFMAQAGFYLAEIARLEFSDYELRFPSVDELAAGSPLEEVFGARLEEKCQRLLRAQYAFTRTVREGHPGWASAAGFKVGQMYEELYETLVGLPSPTDLSLAQQDLYRDLLRERVLILLEKAVSIWQSTADMATRTGEDNEWVVRTRESLGRLKSYVMSQGASGPSAG